MRDLRWFAARVGARRIALAFSGCAVVGALVAGVAAHLTLPKES